MTTDIEEELACRLLEYAGCGDIDTDIDIGNVTVSVRGYIKVYGYTEDDFRCGYMNGTGYSVTTSADIRLSFDAKEYDDDGNLLEDAPEIDGDAVKEYLYGEIFD